MDRSIPSLSVDIIICFGLTLVSGCVPSTLTTYKTSAVSSSNAVSHEWFSGVIVDLPGDIKLRISPPSQPNAEAMIFSVEIQAGHTAHFDNGVADISGKDPPKSWTGQLVTIDGYRYKNPESEDKISDELGADVTRHLVGSTWNTHHFGEHEHSLYTFQIRSELPYPKLFQVQLPPIIIDGNDVVVPKLIFRFQKWVRWQGIGGS
jgi:hypothetical protein